jgi:uncharacterized protein (DUF1501 family)
MLIKRRNILRGLAGAGAMPLFLNALSAEAAGTGSILVVIGLNGGNDGLNTVIPLKQYGQYATLRTPVGGGGTLAYSKAQLAATAFNDSPATAANHATEFAFAPSMTAMRQLYATGKLAVITGIGLPTAELAPLSHFNGWSDWSTGQINVDAGSLPPGWLGTTLASAGGALGPTASLSGGQLVTTSASGQGLVVDNLANFGLSIPYYIPQFNLGDAFQKMLSIPAANATAARAVSVTNATLSASSAMQSFAQLASGYPQTNSYLGQQLRQIAQMISGGAGVRGYVAVDYGYDTHSNQNGSHPALLQDFANQLSQFYTYLHGKGLSKNVVIATISDFGRTPGANLSLGTDHGAASVAFVLGDQVKGGVYGTYPSLTKFDANNNLAVNVDFRNMLSDLIQAMGGNAKTILGTTYPRLGFI